VQLTLFIEGVLIDGLIDPQNSDSSRWHWHTVKELHKNCC